MAPAASKSSPDSYSILAYPWPAFRLVVRLIALLRNLGVFIGTSVNSLTEAVLSSQLHSNLTHVKKGLDTCLVWTGIPVASDVSGRRKS